MQKALQDRIEHIQQDYREEQDLNMKLVQRALQDLQEEADKKKQKRVRLFFFMPATCWKGFVSSQSFGRRLQIYNSATLSVVHEPTASAPSGKMLETEIHRLQNQDLPIKIMTGTGNLCFSTLPQVILMLTNV